MAEPAPKPYFNMNKFRKALKAMYVAMQRNYTNADSLMFRDHDGIIQFVKVPFPQLYQFEIRQERRKEDRL